MRTTGTVADSAVTSRFASAIASSVTAVLAVLALLVLSAAPSTAAPSGSTTVSEQLPAGERITSMIVGETKSFVVTLRDGENARAQIGLEPTDDEPNAIAGARLAMRWMAGDELCTSNEDVAEKPEFQRQGLSTRRVYDDGEDACTTTGEHRLEVEVLDGQDGAEVGVVVIASVISPVPPADPAPTVTVPPPPAAPTTVEPSEPIASRAPPPVIPLSSDGSAVRNGLLVAFVLGVLGAGAAWLVRRD